jgi:hypothetical protein
LLAFDESIAPVQKIDIILDRRVIRFALESFLEFFPRFGQFAAQHIGITLVIENLRGFSNKLNGLPIRAVCQIEPPEMVIGGCKSDPCFWVLRGFFDRILKIPLRCSVNPAIEIFLAQVQWFVRRVVFYVPGDKVVDTLSTPGGGGGGGFSTLAAGGSSPGKHPASAIARNPAARRRKTRAICLIMPLKPVTGRIEMRELRVARTKDGCRALLIAAAHASAAAVFAATAAGQALGND